MNKNSKIFVAGHRGLVGSAIVRSLKAAGYTNLLTVTHAELDLTDIGAVYAFFKKHEPEHVFLAAAKVAGIEGNLAQPVQMLMNNTLIQNNVLWSAHNFGVKKLLFLGSSCIYPRLCPQPIKEEYLLTSALEPSNEAYAIAKIAGVKLCQAFRRQYESNFVSVMPTNLYGVNDTYSPGCHVIPDLIRKFYQAKVSGQTKIVVWGDGTARREFLYSDDLARACVVVMEKYDEAEPINIGFGSDLAIRELACMIADTVGVDRNLLVFEASGPTGTPVKRLDSSKVMALGWKPVVSLANGLKIAYADFLKNHAAAK
jgi:GDP-L-fucose synthase